jgi:mannose-6-phosphate isomerase-like protein (cupin superfamily)
VNYTANTDETFMVIDGELRIDFRDGSVPVSAGEISAVDGPPGTGVNRAERISLAVELHR